MTYEPPARPAVLDSHVHFWDPSRLSYPWLATAPELDRPFRPDDLAAAAPEPLGAIFVEAGCAQPAAEVAWVRAQARTRPWILGAVAHASLGQDGQEDEVRAHADDPFVVGVRHNVQDEPPGYLARSAFRAGVRLLGEASLPFDACVREHQLPELAELAAACPATTIVLDHLGKPSAPTGAWRHALSALASRPNVVCKLSGLATEVPAGAASADTVLALLREALDTFGPDRCLYGGDWPVMTCAARYEDWPALVRTALVPFPRQAADAVLHGNAARTYAVDPARVGPKTVSERSGRAPETTATTTPATSRRSAATSQPDGGGA